MITENTILHTALASMERSAPELLEVHFKSGQRIALAGILQITAQLDQHNWAGPHQVLVVFPNEPLDFDPVAMTTDHIEGRPVEERTRFMAIMVGDPTNMPLFAQHFALVPNDLKIRLFLEVEQARAWLAQEARMAFPN